MLKLFSGVEQPVTEIQRRCNMTLLTRSVAALIAIGVSVPVHAARAQEIPVYVSASFTGRNNLYIEDLAPDEVEILQDGKPRRIEFMARDALPVAYGMIFERSLLGDPAEERRFGLSVPGPAAARNLAYELVDKHLRRQVFWIGCYDKELAVALDFTSDAFQAHAAIQQLRGARGPEESFLYGALFAALRRMSERHEKRKVLIVFLESVDPGTLDRIKPLQNIVSLHNVELFFVRFGARTTGRPGSVAPQMSDAALRELAGATAGEAFSAAVYGDHPEDLSRRLYNHIRTLYTFGFLAEPRGEPLARLSIRCTRPGCKVRARRFVPAGPGEAGRHE